MPEPTKQYYRISEVSLMLDVPIPTLLYWEKKFPSFNPTRSAKGHRRFTPADVEAARYIRGLVWGKGLKVEAAAEYMGGNYRLSPPRGKYKCDSPKSAVALLNEVAESVENEHASAKLRSVINYIKSLSDSIR